MATIFVSYSHHDGLIIEQIVQLLRTAIAGACTLTPEGNDFVFFDKDRLIPGVSWNASIDEAIFQSTKMFVFWCKHSAESSEVKREYEHALRTGRIVIPVLVDKTPLPQALAPIHGVDLRALKLHGPRVRGFAPHVESGSAADFVLTQFAPVLGYEPEILIRGAAGS